MFCEKEVKILCTSHSYYPSVGGVQEAVKQIGEFLATWGHEVVVATAKDSHRKEMVINEVKIAEFAVSGNLVVGMTGETTKYQEFLLNGDFDIVINFAAQQWATDLTLQLLPRIKAKKIFVPTGFSGLYNPDYQNYFQSMKLWLGQYDMNVFLGNDYRDINFAKDCGVKRLIVIPNGASFKEFSIPTNIDTRRKLQITTDTFFILHVGSHTGAKGHAEAREIFSRADIPNSVFVIIGNDHPGGCLKECVMAASTNRKIIITFLTRPETVAAFKQADLFLFPSNIECSPIVLFEAMAAKTPFLTTDVGNAREIVSWTKGGMLLPTEKLIEKKRLGYSRAKIGESVQVLKRIYTDKARRKRMARDGYAAWKKKFTWEKITRQYETLCKQILRA